ncbi:ABC transporter permease [Demequina pelophila]|uniref:ABC transporter permease n=1 Tax=Demequina pelophila TaxID=1638984 RepID=UPI0007843AD8|nr:ABC transporter permease [Demequina pelophila]
MTRFVLRRLAVSSLILLVGSLLMFVLTINSGDPLEDLRESTASNRDQLMQSRITNMGLDQPWYVRYFTWLSGAAGCLIGKCDLGTDRAGSDVTALLAQAAGSTLRLVTIATFAAIIVGVIIGIITAIRQYSGFDYVVTFISFLFFSLPVFWAAVLLKEFGAIRFNDWIADPQISLLQAIVTGLVLAVILSSIMGGDWKRRLLTGAITGVFVVAALMYFTAVGWWRNPALGVGLVALVSLGFAVGLVALITGLGNRRVLYSTLTTVGVGIVVYFAVAPLLDEPNWLLLAGLFVSSLVIGLLIGRLWGGYSKGTAMALSAVTATFMAAMTFLDHLVYAWAGFLQLKPRPISTIGSQTPNFPGDFWETTLDWGTQLLLPTALLTLVSVASYQRYTRASMLETLNQDYVRTARSKGLGERTVIVKHAFRNALIPITTIVAFNFAGLISGAVITETVFGWKGMGELFKSGLNNVDPAPVMAFFLVTAIAAIVMNMIADIAYAFLDPRIRR